MSRELELREKRAKLWDATKAYLDTNRDKDGLVTAEVEAEYDRMVADIEVMGKEIKRLEREARLDIEMSKETSDPILNAPESPKDKTGRASDEYKEDFGVMLRGGTPVHNILSTTPGADGGFLVPKEFDDKIVAGLEENNVVRSLAKVITTATERKIPIAATHSVAQWTAENAAYVEKNPTFAQKALDAYKMTDLIKVSNELLQDSMFDIESYIVDEFAWAFASLEEESFCVGTGTGQPSGIFTAKGGTVGETTAALTVDNLINLFYTLKRPYRQKAAFLMADKTVAVIRKFKDTTGLYLWQPSIKEGEPDRLLGRPLYTSAFAPNIGKDKFPIAFGDFSNYVIGDRSGRTLQRLNEVYANNGQVGFIAAQRLDGMVILTEGIQLLKTTA